MLAYGSTGAPQGGSLTVTIIGAVVVVAIVVAAGVLLIRQGRVRALPASSQTTAVQAAAAELFTRFWHAWQGTGDRAALELIATPGLFADWCATLDKRERPLHAPIQTGPTVDVLACDDSSAQVCVRARMASYGRYDFLWTLQADGQARWQAAKVAKRR